MSKKNMFSIGCAMAVLPGILALVGQQPGLGTIICQIVGFGIMWSYRNYSKKD